MVRLLIRLGWGILPSFTIASNRLGETPIYAAASERDKPRGGSEGGRRSAAFRICRLAGRVRSCPPELLGKECVHGLVRSNSRSSHHIGLHQTDPCEGVLGHRSDKPHIVSPAALRPSLGAKRDEEDRLRAVPHSAKFNFNGRQEPAEVNLQTDVFAKLQLRGRFR